MPMLKHPLTRASKKLPATPRRSILGEPKCGVSELEERRLCNAEKSVLAVIDSDSYRVDAHFEETKIPQIKTGSEAEIRLMDGSPALNGRVDSIARGITDRDNSDGPPLLSNVNPNFTQVRLAQLIPVASN